MKAVVFFATGYEEIEALAVVDILRRGGVEVIMAGVDGMCVKSGRGITVEMDQKAEAIQYDTVDMLFVPGGVPGVVNLANAEVVQHQLKQFKAEGKWIGAICAGPGVLGKLGLLKGEKAVCYPGFEHELEGATLVAERIVQSGKIVTGIGAGASMAMGLTLLACLKGEACANEVKEAMHIL